MEKLEQKIGQIDPGIAHMIECVQKAGNLFGSYKPKVSEVRPIRKLNYSPRFVKEDTGSYVLVYN